MANKELEQARAEIVQLRAQVAQLRKAAAPEYIRVLFDRKGNMLGTAWPDEFNGAPSGSVLYKRCDEDDGRRP